MPTLNLKSKVRKKLFYFVAIIMIGLSSNKVYAIDSISIWQETPYTEEYQNWLKLSEEEKKTTISPRKYEVRNSNAVNLFRSGRITRSALATKYNLREFIPENVIIKDQMSTNECWAFAGIAVLESNLALRDKLENRGVTVYDYSERHMDYSTVREFEDGTNLYGYRDVGSGGWTESVEMYLTNGRGAILEEDMPFINNGNTISLNEIQNKTVRTKVEDTVYFEAPPNNDIISTEYKEWQNQVKQHIIEYGGIKASYYNEPEYDSTPQGSYYCNDDTQWSDHAVTIIGWDDEYSVDNFTGIAKPTYPGAWIIKNSWGTGEYEVTWTIEESKNNLFEIATEACKEQGWNNAEEIPEDIAIGWILENGYTYNETTNAYTKVIDTQKYEGYWYISYEDAAINESLYGIKNAKTEVDYDNLYQHDVFGATYSINTSKESIPGEEQKVYLANVFKKNTNTLEKLNEVSIITNQTYICKVYVNPNGISKAKEDLIEVELETGEYEKIDAGYHTLKFAEPIDIIGDNFVVIIEVENNDSTQEKIIVETEEATSTVDTVTVNEGESYLARGNEFENNIWIDAGSSLNANLCIKAFTTNGVDSIRIETLPTKTEYIEGTNFDNSGLVVICTIDEEEIKITEYEVVNGTNLNLEQTSVTIKYEGIEIQVPITVVEKSLDEIKITKEPDKKIYIEGQNFDRTGMVVEAIYDNGYSKTITDYTVADGDNLKANKTAVTISYTENGITKQTIQIIEITEKAQGSISNIQDLSKVYDGVSVVDPTYDKVGDGEVTFEWYKLESTVPEKLETVPTNAGTYKVKVILAEGQNYTGAESEKIFTISKATYDMSGISFTDASYTYDGTEKSIVISGTLPEGVSVTYKGNTKTDVGQSYATAMFTGDSTNYEPIENMIAILTITARAGSISNIQDLSKTYDGVAVIDPTIIKVGDGEVSIGWYKLENDREISLNEAPINAGTYKVKVIMAATTNYSGAQAEKEFIIEKATPTVTVPTNLIAIYGETLADVELPEGFNWEADLNTSVGNVGKNKFKAKYTPTDTQNYKMITNIDVEITVEKATYDMSGISFTDASYTYDGTEKSIVISGNLPEGVSVTYKGNTKTNVGQSYATAMFTGDTINYNEIPNMTAILTIEKAQGSISNIQDLSKVYNGVVVTEPTYDKVGDGEVTIEWYKLESTVPEKLETVPTNAGTYKVKVILVEGQNYTGAESEKTFTISKATYDMSNVSFEDVSYVFDGTEKKVEIIGTLPEGVSVRYENNIGINSGEYNATAMFTGDTVNYNEIPNMTAKLTISAKVGLISNISDLSKIYDGQPVRGPIYTTLGDGQVTLEWYKLEGEKETKLETAPVNAGNYIVKLTMEPTINYTGVEDKKEFTIEKATYDMSNVSFTDASYVYDGTEKKIEIAGTLPEGVSVRYEGNTGINAGEYNATAIFTGDSVNYNTIENKTAKLAIEKAQGRISNIQDLSKIYDGQAVMDPTYEKLGDGQVSVAWYKITGNTANPMDVLPTNVGSYLVKVTLLEGSNYKGVEDQKIFTIEKATPTYNIPEELTAIEGKKLSSINLPEGFSWENDIETKVENIGENKFLVTYTPQDTENYNIVTGIEVVVTVIAKPEIDLGEYEETEDEQTGRTYIENIDQNTTVEQIKEELGSNGEIEIYKGGEKIEDGSKIATGMEVRITLENNETMSYEAVVRGDITGDGQINDADLLILARYMVGFEKEKQMVTGSKLRATDVVKDNIFATDGDLLKLAKILVGLDNL